MSEFSWDNKFAGAQMLLAKVKLSATIQHCTCSDNRKRKKQFFFFFQEFYRGKKNLSKFKTDIESFICALMPGSSSVQIRTTPGTYLSLIYTIKASNKRY